MRENVNLSTPDTGIERMLSDDSRVVGALRHVDMVVRVNGLLAAQLSTQDLDGSVGDDFVDVHVGLGTGSSLENDQREVVDELSGDDLIGSLADGVDDLGVEACSGSNEKGERRSYLNDLP